MLLKTKIIVSASAALVILGGSLLVLSNMSIERADARYREATLRQTEMIWQKISTAQIDTMKNNIKGLTRNSEAIEALESNVVEDIEDETGSTFNRLTASKIIESLKLFNAKGELKYAEPVIKNAGSTPTLVTDALKQGKPQSGLIQDMDGQLALALAFPLYQKSVLVGVGVYARSLRSAINDLKKTDGSEAAVVTPGDGLTIGTTPEFFAELSIGAPNPGQKQFNVLAHNSHFFAVSKVPLIDAQDVPLGHLISIVDKTESFKEQQFFDNAAKIGLVLIFVIAIVGLNIFLRYNFKAFGTMIKVLNSLAQGNTDIEVQGTERHDEIGDISRAVLIFRDNAIERVRLEEEERKQDAERQRNVDVERARSDQENAEKLARQERIDGLTAGFGSTVEDILGVVVASSSEMEVSAQSMSEIARQTQDESTTVATAAEETASNVQTVASATEELSSSIGEISRQVTLSAEISGKAVSSANESNVTVRELADAAQRIGEVVEMINDIANQTNLLALNATIEAARAGEAGKGFAVVASEVKNLASQTAKATEDIGSQIGDIQNSTKEAVSAIEGIGQKILEMNEIATSIASAVEQQGAATSEISRSVQDVASGTQSVTRSIGTVRTGSAQTGEASGIVLNASRELSERFENLRTEVEEFLKDIRAA